MIAPPMPRNEHERIAYLHALEVLDTPPEPELEELTWLAAEVCKTPIALVTLIDRDRQWFLSNRGMPGTETARALSFCAHAIEQVGVLEIQDAEADPRFAHNPLVRGAPFIRFYAGAPLRTNDGLALGTLCVIDTVPRKLTEAQERCLRTLGRQVMRHLELRALAKRLAMEAERTQLMARRKAGLLAYIGHEVRNALMTLKGSLHVLPRELLPEKKQQALDHAKRAVDDIDRLTGDVLDASRVELGRFEKREEAVDVRMELDDLGRAYARDAGVALRVEAEPSVPHAVMLDRQRVLQVLHNLVANAFKFTDDGEVRLRVRAVFGRDGADAAREALVFEVEDTGRGMAPSQLQLLFEPFVQADDASPAEGLGLGLFVSRRVAEALGGSLSAESALGRGSTFRLSVPLVPVDA